MGFAKKSTSGGGGKVVNGVLGEFYSGYNVKIPPSSFVEKIAQSGVRSDSVSSEAKAVVNCVLNDTTFIRGCTTGSSTIEFRKVTCSNGATTLGGQLLIYAPTATTSWGTSVVALHKIDDSRVLAIYTSNLTYHAAVLDVSGDKPVAGTAVSVGVATAGIDYIWGRIAHVSGEKFLVCVDNGIPVYGVILQTSGMTVTVVKSKVNVGQCAQKSFDLKKVADNLFALSHGRSTLTLSFINTANDGIVVDSSTVINSSSNTAFGSSIAVVDSNTLFISHSNASSSYYLNGMVVKINGSAITQIGTDVALETATQTSGRLTFAFVLSDNKVVIFARKSGADGVNYYRAGVYVVAINGTTVTLERVSTISNTLDYMNSMGSIYAASSPSAGRIYLSFLGKSTGSSCYSFAGYYYVDDNKVIPATSAISGLSKSNITDKVPGKAYVLA